MKQRISQLVGGLLLTMSLALGLVVVPAQEATAATNNNETGFDFFVAKGLTKKQSAGIIGNLIQESGTPIDPRADQPGGPGKGIAQWSEGGRWDELIKYARNRGQSRYSLNLQLNFVWYELERYPFYGLAELRDARSVREATKAFQDNFERCGKCDFNSRLRYAEGVYDDYANGTETSLPTLRKGDRSNAVRTLQYLLNEEGYDADTDKIFGRQTVGYVKDFQRSEGLKADGVVGPNTWDALLPTLRRGDRGYDVRALQRELNAERGINIDVDSKFGGETQSALVEYQNRKGLESDGIAGPKTWGSLID